MVPTTPLPALTASLGDWALWYAAHGWPVFPCHGKVAAIKGGFYRATTDLQQIASWWAQWPNCNIGLPTGEHLWALDVDERHDGLATLHDLEQSYGALPRTVTSLTGSHDGSMHLLWAIGETMIHNKAKVGIGIDIQGPGSYIILPPSIHPGTKQPYIWEADFGPDDLDPQLPPPWLEALVTQGPDTTTDETNGTAAPIDGPILEGSRETTLMRLAGAMRRQGATGAGILAALEAENQRCMPPLDAKDLARMAHSVERYAPAPVLEVSGSNGVVPPVGWSVSGVNGATITAGMNTEWRKELFAKKNGELTQNITNFRLILENHEQWRRPVNALWWDSVRGQPMCGDAEIEATLMNEICDWFGRAERLPVTMTDLAHKCILAVCKRSPRDLLQLWLNSLPPWDNVPRLRSWFVQIVRAQDSVYTQEIGYVLLLSMVARALRPGCHYRFVVVLEGEEAIGKTSLVKALAGEEWYGTLSMNLESKESHMMLQGVWVAEMPDLDSYNRTEETRLKAFITLHEDTYIPKFSNFREKTPRRAIFIGTTNDESYFKGQSGNTRYLPIRCQGEIDLEAFLTIRTQLFAEALHEYQAHPDDWWKLSEEALIQAKEAREQRRIQNYYEQPLHEWLDQGRFQLKAIDEVTQKPVRLTFDPNETTWPEIARWFLQLDTPEKWKDKGLQMQIASALRAIGWRVTQVWKHGRNTNVWRKDSSDVPF